MNNLAQRGVRLLWIACPVLLFTVMFGHMTAVIYNGIALLAIGLACAVWSAWRRPGALPGRWPLVAPFAAWAAWTLITLLWSRAPQVSLHAWLDEVAYPFMAFLGFWVFGSRAKNPEKFAIVTWVACALLTLISVVNWGHLQPPTADTFSLHYYNRVGHTSTLVVFAMALFAGLMVQSGQRWLGVTGLLFCLFVGLATLNRAFWPAAAITLMIGLYPLLRKRLLISAGAGCVVAVLALGSFGLSTHLRFGDAAPQAAERNVDIDGHQLNVSAALQGIDAATSNDTRPMMWAFYTHAGAAHWLTGIGFGKPLPGMAYRAEAPAKLLALEPQALTHAHNLFINTWLQTGVVGLILQAVLLLALGWRFWTLRHLNAPVSAAGIALVAGMVAKNMTDDLMWETTILAFWAFSGLLLGVGERCRAMQTEKA
jgi:hypothetical protein